MPLCFPRSNCATFLSGRPTDKWGWGISFSPADLLRIGEALGVPQSESSDGVFRVEGRTMQLPA